MDLLDVEYEDGDRNLSCFVAPCTSSNYQDVPTNLDLVFLTKCIFPKGKGALEEVPEFLQLIGKKVKLFLKLMIRTAWIVSDLVKFASLYAVTRLKSAKEHIPEIKI